MVGLTGREFEALQAAAQAASANLRAALGEQRSMGLSIAHATEAELRELSSSMHKLSEFQAG